MTAWLEASVFLGDAGDLPDSVEGWLKYRQYLEFLAEDEPSKKELIAELMSRGWCVGGREFKQQMKQELPARGTELELYAGLEPDEIRAVCEDSWESHLRADVGGCCPD